MFVILVCVCVYPFSPEEGLILFEEQRASNKIIFSPS